MFSRSAPRLSRSKPRHLYIKEGDWWRVKIEVARPEGVSVAGAQLGGFPEYRVQIDSGKERVFGLRGDISKEVEAPAIVSLVLGKKGWLGELLRFPLRVGSNWTEQLSVSTSRAPKSLGRTVVTKSKAGRRL